ncbi:hypothetical protein [Modestobacter roseus]|uniref:Uncharacterized protein n=1 Tax=Modestobacter roseus TaxID=1181884 RepID=A0A562IQJ6_9ACTN|nr:hypothetical protein [Modestobacter roseus]MQA33131.1 hypothetical protein [Modestobacter roseus]TWH73319.1 hypothetical protein JD78_01842 [Modestobacter roseus]
MRIRRTSAALSAFTVLAVVLAGCSGGSEDDPAAAEQESPLAEYMNAVYGGDLSPEEQEQQFTEQQAEREELVAQCMQEQGFEYTPDTQSSSFSSGDGTEWEPDDREWVSQYGYGAVNSPFSEEPVQPEEEYVDPNGDYVMSLSESEQAAFYEALYGPQPTEEEIGEDGSYEYDWQTAGCQGAAQHEVEGEDVSQSDEFKPLFDAMNEFYEGMSSWPGMTELEAEWAACMDAAGHGGFATQYEAQDSIYEDLNAIYEEMVPTEDGEVSGEPDEAARDALAEREVELALADLDCREETDYRDRAAEVNREAEQQFVDDHESELEAMKAAAEQD